MTVENVQETDVKKALGALQDVVSKGHNSRGTATTQVETMREGGAGAGSDAGSTQVFHTPSNSNPNGWAGSSETSCPDDGASDAISENGTDYDGAAKMAKSIMDKMRKGLALNAEECEFVAKGYMAFGKDKEDDDDNDKEKEVKKAKDDDDEDTKKSLADHASEDPTVAAGLEISDFLKGFVDVTDKALQSQEARLIDRIVSALASNQAETNAFQKSLGEAVTGLANCLAQQAQSIEQIESTPARGPMSTASVQSIEKGFGEGGPTTTEENLTKSQVNDALFDMLQQNKVSRVACLKFDATGEIDPRTLEQVKQHRAGN